MRFACGVRSMETLRLVSVLTALWSAQASPQGLLCTNDLVNNVSCVWNGSAVDPGADCLITGVKRASVKGKFTTIRESCKLKHQENSPPGCSFVFENREFAGYEEMPNISVRCDGALLETVKPYKLSHNIKMQPPGAPNVSRTAEGARISWSAGRISDYLRASGIRFQIQVKRRKQTWSEAMTLHTHMEEETVDDQRLKGHCQVRVRVQPLKRVNSKWSDWSPTTSWMAAPENKEASETEEWWMQQNTLISVGLLLPLCGITVVLLVIYRCCKTRGLLKKKPVPSPSDYFHTLHSVHGGNLKKWLNPLSVSESFFTAQRCDHISPVVLCEEWCVVASTSPSSSSTNPLLHRHDSPPEGADTGQVAANSSSSSSSSSSASSSSSCFSNMGYFMSGSSGVSVRTDPSPAYFSYQDDPRALRPHLGASLAAWPAYESLKREPHSPDSGFCFGKEDEMELDIREEEELDDLKSRFLILPLNLPPRPCPPAPSPPSSPPPICAGQTPPDIQQVEEAVTAADEHAADAAAAGWPVSAAMCRASSMPVESCKSGYLTLKELQTTFSNKSI